MRVTIRQLQPYVSRVVKGWHPAFRRSLREYSLSRQPRSGRRWINQARRLPYWLETPQWLAGQFLGKRSTNQKFLFDSLCGQFAVFLALKIHDDMFDEQARDRSLLFVADHFLISARSAFAPYFSSNSRFWTFFDSSIAQTLNAIIAFDQAELRGYGSRSSVAALMREGYAACNIATYAVCLRAKRIRLFETVAQCMGELAYVGQILDDLEDMIVDFKRGRVNYAAYCLVGQSIDRRKNLSGQLTSGIILKGTGERFFKMLLDHLQRARETAEITGLPMLVEYVERQRSQLTSIETHWHQKRVHVLFESALKDRR